MDYELNKILNKLECLALSIKTADAERYADISSEMYGLICDCRLKLNRQGSKDKVLLTIASRYNNDLMATFRADDNQIYAISTVFEELGFDDDFTLIERKEMNIIDL